MKLEGTVSEAAPTQKSAPLSKHLLPFGAGTGPSLNADALEQKTAFILVLSFETQTWSLHLSHRGCNIHFLLSVLHEMTAPPSRRVESWYAEVRQGTAASSVASQAAEHACVTL